MKVEWSIEARRADCVKRFKMKHSLGNKSASVMQPLKRFDFSDLVYIFRSIFENSEQPLDASDMIRKL